MGITKRRNHLWHVKLLLLLCSSNFLVLPALAQLHVVPEVALGINFNGTDAMLNVGAGVSFQNIRTSAKLSFQPRLGAKRVLIETASPNVLLQYRERRYLLGLEVDKRVKLTEFSEYTELGLFVGGFIGMSFNDYRGTDARGSVDLGYQGMAGAYFGDARVCVLRLGYLYLPLPTQNVFPHRIGFSCAFLLTDGL
jgi:hypothetical protein